jgi:hypothetical protein
MCLSAYAKTTVFVTGIGRPSPSRSNSTPDSRTTASNNASPFWRHWLITAQ